MFSESGKRLSSLVAENQSKALQVNYQRPVSSRSKVPIRSEDIIMWISQQFDASFYN